MLSRVAWIVLSVTFLGLAALAAWLAPLGGWQPRFLNLEFHSYADPDGYYLAAGIAFSNLSVWSGHPGIPVVLVVRGVASAIYGVAYAVGASSSYDAFAVRHLTEIAFLTRVIIALAHVGCMCLVHRLSLRMIPSRAVAAVATLAYATSWQVLFYSKRISVEPFMVGLALYSILLFFHWLDLAGRRAVGTACVCAGLTGATIAAGVLSKFTILMPMLLFMAVSMLWVRWSFDGEQRITWQVRCSGFVAFAMGSALTLWAGSAWVDWPNFFTYWFHYSGTELAFDPSRSVAENLAAGLPRFLLSMLEMSSGFVERGGRARAALYGHLVELLSLTAALVGAFIALRARAVTRRRLLWIVLLVLAITPIPIFRNFMHYWFVHVAIAAPFSA